MTQRVKTMRRLGRDEPGSDPAHQNRTTHYTNGGEVSPSPLLPQRPCSHRGISRHSKVRFLAVHGSVVTEQEKIAQPEQKMPSGRVRCELLEGFRAVRELQHDESRRAGPGE